MRAIPFCLFILLSGCGGGCCDPTVTETNHGYGWEYDAIGPQGLRLRKAGATPREAEVFETRARNVAICAGDDPMPPPPFVIFVPPGSIEGGYAGWYFEDPPLILLEDHILFEHETMHYLLDRRGDLDPGHTSPLWKSCFIPAGQ